MMRKVLSIAMFLMGILCVSAQQPQFTPLPLNPAVKSGVLDNGLHYYILHNEEPKNRANFYIAQKVGSTLENPEQLGLAHFLEHMAFNGTKNFPGKNLLNYLQNKGIRFGADINAYTGFDETVYNINNVPTNDVNLMDSCLLALHDWSCEISLVDSEIDAERGVIREEWRARNNADSRMMEKVLPAIFEEYQYQQMPIGKMEIVENFKYDVLRDYYHKWYRPDLQGIIIVGDFDAAEMEKKVKELFSTIPAVKNAAKRVYPEVSKNKKPIYVEFEDPEMKQSTVRIAFKEDITPREMRSTVEGYLYGPVIESIITMLLDNRLSEYAAKPECPYAAAGVYFSNYWVSSTMYSFNVYIAPKGNMTKEATDAAMGIIARACKTGFTDSELSRVRDELLSQYDQQYNERDKTNSNALGKELIRHFIDNQAAPGIEIEYDLVKQVLPGLPVQVINELSKQLLTSDNQVIVVAQPKKDGYTLLGADVMETSIADAMKADYEPYVDEVITDPLIAQLPAPGKVNNIQDNAALGATEITLSNGVKVIVKTTDFSADQILFQAFKEGGKRSYPETEAANVALMGDVFDMAKWGPFDMTTLRKYLAGKNVTVNYNVGNATNYLEGGSSVKDLNTLMEIIYTAFTGLTADQELYNTMIEKAVINLENKQSDPNYQFSVHMNNAQYGNNPMMAAITPETLKSADYNKMLDMLHQSLANAADYTFIFTGNVDVATLRPLLEQYVATLPVARRKKVQELSSIKPVLGEVKDYFNVQAQTPSVSVFDNWSGDNVPYNVENSVRINLLGDILDMIYTETLREEEGGTYSPYVGGYMNPNTGFWQVMTVFQTNTEQAPSLIERAGKEWEKLLTQGADPEKFNKVKEAAIKQYENNVRTNGYWIGGIMSYLRGFDTITGHEAAIKNLTLEDFNAFIKTIYNGKNEIEVVMTAGPQDK